jgi:hypothetical protein
MQQDMTATVTHSPRPVTRRRPEGKDLPRVDLSLRPGWRPHLEPSASLVEPPRQVGE